MKTLDKFMNEANKRAILGQAHYAMIEAKIWLDIFADHGAIEGKDLNAKQKRDLKNLVKQLEMSAKAIK